MSAETRVGLLGGTFDPIHEGHLSLARACAESLALDEVRLLAAHRPPHKRGAVADGIHRHAMLALATSGDPLLVADPRELRRPGPSYTIDTLDEIRRERPEAKLFFLAGADSLRDLRSWHRWDDVLAAATFVACGRSGVSEAEVLSAWAEELDAGRIVSLSHEPPAWSSRRLREALRAGSLPDGALPECVTDYVRKNELYSSLP